MYSLSLLWLLLRVADGDAQAMDALQDPDDGCLRPAKGLPHAFRITALEAKVGAERIHHGHLRP